MWFASSPHYSSEPLPLPELSASSDPAAPDPAELPPEPESEPESEPEPEPEPDPDDPLL